MTQENHHQKKAHNTGSQKSPSSDVSEHRWCCDYFPSLPLRLLTVSSSSPSPLGLRLLPSTRSRSHGAKATSVSSYERNHDDNIFFDDSVCTGRSAHTARILKGAGFGKDGGGGRRGRGYQQITSPTHLPPLKAFTPNETSRLQI